MLSRLLWVVYFCVIFSCNTLSVELSPLIFRFSLDRSFTQELNVINGENESVRYRVNIIKPSNLKDSKLYMGEWIRYYPKILSVPPKSARVVRFRVTPPKGLADGEYRAYLSLEEIPKKIDPNTVKSAENADVEEEVQVSLTHYMRYNLSLYGEKGELIPNIEFKEFDIVQYPQSKDRLNVKGQILNKGNYSTQSVALITFKDSKGKQVGETVEVVLPIVIRENTADFDLAFPKPKGDLKVAEIEIRYWTFTETGDLIEHRKINL